jgi:hypothetical protein
LCFNFFFLLVDGTVRFLTEYQGFFTSQVFNKDVENMVIIGVRIHLGSNSMERSPQYFEFFGRTVQVNDQQGPRWYDLGLTREESIQAEKKLAIFIAQSPDANQVTVIDDVKVYGKNKGEFSWPEELDSVVTNAAVAAPNSLPAINGYLHSFRQTMDEKDSARSIVSLQHASLHGCLCSARRSREDWQRHSSFDLSNASTVPSGSMTTLFSTMTERILRL